VSAVLFPPSAELVAERSMVHQIFAPPYTLCVYTVCGHRFDGQTPLQAPPADEMDTENSAAQGVSLNVLVSGVTAIEVAVAIARNAIEGSLYHPDHGFRTPRLSCAWFAVNSATLVSATRIRWATQIHGALTHTLFARPETCNI
jgi:hypothetical protein